MGYVTFLGGFRGRWLLHGFASVRLGSSENGEIIMEFYSASLVRKYYCCVQKSQGQLASYIFA